MTESEATFDAMIYQSKIDALAEYVGAELRNEHDDAAPMPWAVWCRVPVVDAISAATWDEDLIGAGASPSEAIEDARATVRGWQG